MRFRLIWLIFMAATALIAEVVVPANENPPLVPLEYRRAGFWIERHPAPDSLMASAEEIKAFNRHCIDKWQCYDLYRFIEAYHSKATKKLQEAEKKQIQALLDYAREQGKYTAAGEKVKPEFWESIRANMQLEAYDANTPPRYALPLRFVNQRLIPYSEALLSEADDREFDQLQNSGIDIGEPTLILHASADGKWLYGRGMSSGGWYLKSEMQMVSQTLFASFLQTEDFVITTEDKCDIYLNCEGTKYYSFARMGTKLPLLGEYNCSFVVQLPDGRAGYIPQKTAHRGYLPYTARNVYLQAFKVLNAPYGWGDLNAEYDCSGYLRALFRCFGLYLPRNGAAQAAVATTLQSFKATSEGRETAIVSKGVPAATLLRMPGHIMLYLGAIDGKAYAIHCIYGYRLPGKDKDTVLKVNKCIVSDLHLGKGSARKSLLERLAGVYQIP